MPTVKAAGCLTLTATGIAMRRRLYWFTLPWGAEARRNEMLAEASREQDVEHKAAVRWGGHSYRPSR